jgi:prophage DNA circulation protein
MSGFSDVTGSAPPTGLPSFKGLHQAASFRGVPFKVVAAQVKKGRRWAIHDYPYVDGGWPRTWATRCRPIRSPAT